MPNFLVQDEEKCLLDGSKYTKNIHHVLIAAITTAPGNVKKKVQHFISSIKI